MRKLQKFVGEQPVITSATYAGEFAGKYIAAALLSATTLDKKLITILPNVKYKQVLQKIAVNSIVNDASCNFVTSGTVALTERIIEPKELQVNLELCKQNFVQSWEALQLGYSAFDEIPKDFTDFLISYVGGTVAQATEQSIWAGVGATNGQFAGLLPALSASVAAATGAVQATGSGAINSSNVLAKLDNVFQTIPNAVYGKEDLVIYVPTNVAKAYQQALGGGAQGANGYNNQMNVGEKPMNFNGVEIAMCPGMTNSYIVAAQKSNLYFGTGLMSDYNEVRVLDMAQIDGSQNFRIIMRYTAATQVAILSDSVIYIP